MTQVPSEVRQHILGFVPIDDYDFVTPTKDLYVNPVDLANEALELGIDLGLVIAKERLRRRDLKRLIGSKVHDLWSCLEEYIPTWTVNLCHSIDISRCVTTWYPEVDDSVINNAEHIVDIIEELFPQFSISTKNRKGYGRPDQVVVILIYPKDDSSAELEALFRDLIRLDQLLEEEHPTKRDRYISVDAA